MVEDQYALLHQVWLTLTYAVTASAIGNLVALALALALERRSVGNMIFRAIFFIPVLLSPLATGYVWTGILDPAGPLNQAISLLAPGFRFAWLGSSSLAIFLVAAVDAWKWLGFFHSRLYCRIVDSTDRAQGVCRIHGRHPLAGFPPREAPLPRPGDNLQHHGHCHRGDEHIRHHPRNDALRTRKDRYIYYHCTFDKGSCGGLYVREEEMERQFEGILGGLQFSEALLDWMREALRQSQKEKAAFHRRAIEKLNAQYSKLQNRIDQIYLDKLDGEVEEAFYRRNVSAWREEQSQVRARIERHEKADQNYIEQGIRLLELTRNAQEFFRTRGQAERAALLGFILSGSTLDQDRVVPTFKPPFDIIHRMAQTAKQAAPDPETACPILLPRPDSNRRPGRYALLVVFDSGHCSPSVRHAPAQKKGDTRSIKVTSL